MSDEAISEPQIDDTFSGLCAEAMKRFSAVCQERDDWKQALATVYVNLLRAPQHGAGIAEFVKIKLAGGSDRDAIKAAEISLHDMQISPATAPASANEDYRQGYNTAVADIAKAIKALSSNGGEAG